MDDGKIQELLFRNVEQVLPSKEEFLNLVKSGKKLKVYHGIDPTGDTLHIGHYAALIKMKHLQELGFEVIIVIGGMTATIGDPDKINVRKQLTVAEVEENAKKIRKQVEKIVEFGGSNPAKMVNNYDWLSKLNFENIIELGSYITHDQMIERDMFQQRIKNNQPIYMHEFMYPLMQGYDSVELEVDCEFGGNDQLFNMMMGRTLLKKMKNKDKFVVTVPLLTDSAGKKIGKTTGNVIPFGNDVPYESYAGIMTLSDDVIIKCFVAITNVSLDEISIMEIDMEKNGANPMIYKKLLAYTLVKEVYGEEEAKKCQAEFEKTVQNKEFSENQSTQVVLEKEEKVFEFLKNNLVGFSNSEIKQVIEQNGLLINNNKVTDLNSIVKKGDEVKFGKKNFFKLV
ncbi:MAG: tyrosine--tRNA ligase [Proteobacteria bacterium]|nr:tyrosine--tRNA ligase [Pseudomonadota bacterium]